MMLCRRCKMTSTRAANNESHERHEAQPRNRQSTKHKAISGGWMKKGGAFVAFLGTCVALVVGLWGPISHLLASTDTIVYTDDQLKIVKVDSEQFEFRLGLTLINKGGKADTIGRPHVVFNSDMPIIR